MTDEEWEIEKIIRKRVRKGEKYMGFPAVEYFVKWKGWDDEYNEWKTELELHDLVGMDYESFISEFEKMERLKARSKPKKEVEKEITKWDEAVHNQKISAIKEKINLKERRKIEMEQRQIDMELAEEARRVAAEAERQERERELVILAEKRAIEAARKQRLEGKRYEVLKVVYADLLMEQKEKEEPIPPRKIRTASRVPSLWHLCLSFVCHNVSLYDGWEHVPILFKAKMFHFMSMNRILSSETFEELLDPLQKYLDLSVCRTSVTVDFFQALKKSPFLTSLTLTDCPNVYFTWFKSLGACPNLEKLNLSGCIEVSTLQGLERCKTLKELNLSGCRRLCSGNTDSIDSLFFLTNLEVLDISGARDIPVTKALRLFQTLPLLTKFIAINSCEQFPTSTASKTVPIPIPTLIPDPIISTKLTVFLWKVLGNIFNLYERVEVYKRLISHLFLKNRFFPQIRELGFSWGWPEITDMMRQYPHLKVLICELPFLPTEQSNNKNSNKISTLSSIFPDSILPSSFQHLEMSFSPSAHSQSSWSAKTYYFHKPSQKILLQLVTMLEGLQVLKLTGLRYATFYPLLMLWKNEKLKPKELDISEWGKLADDKHWLTPVDVTLSKVPFPRRPELVKLILKDCNFFHSFEVLSHLVNSKLLPNLEYLDMTENQYEKKLPYATESFPKLQTFICSFPSYAQYYLAGTASQQLQNLTLSLTGSHSSLPWKVLFKCFPKIKNLTVTNPHTDLNIDLKKLFKAVRKHGRYMRVLTLGNARLYEPEVEHLVGSKSLEMVKTNHVRSVTYWKSYSFQVVPVDEIII